MPEPIHLRRSCLAAGAALLVALNATTTPAAPLFPAHSTVVLLVGLPGDIESENSYRSQLQSWLQLACDSGRVQRLFFLCDNPESVTIPAGLAAKPLKADRQAFLSLREELASATNALVVVAWGHGGTQGSTPVLHVRGPRLTSADFAEVSAHAPAARSQWLLMFRGSSSFARQLMGKSRDIISSDYEQSFSSDPVAMPILLNLAKSSEAASFELLADALGKDITAWYSERNLALMEEPTLWRSGEPARLLAKSRAETSKTGSETASQPTAGAEASSKTGTAQTNTVAELPSPWREVKRAAAVASTNSDAIILRQRLSCSLGKGPAVVTEQEQFIEILTPEGKQFGDFDVSYSPPSEEIEFLDCEVLRPDGQILRLDPNAITEMRDQPAGDYQPVRRKMFSLPGVAPGAILHVRYRTLWNEFPLPEISMTLPVGHELPALDSTIEVSVPKGSVFHFGFEDISAPVAVLKQTTYSTAYLWRFGNLPALTRELLTAPNHRPRLVISTFADWASFAGWFERISRLSDEVTPAIAAKATELTRGATSDSNKVLALYNYVARLRYVAVPMGINSVRPHAAANVLENQFGDCKDKANLFNALLHALNIESELVLVPRFGEVYDSIPGMSFNHAISRVKVADHILWVDTTDDVCRFGLLPPGDPGRNVLVVKEQTAALTRLPPPDPKDHRLVVRGAIDCAVVTDSLPLSLRVTAFGYPDYELRSSAREMRVHQSSLPLLAAHLRPWAGSFALQEQNATAVSDLSENFSWSAKGSLVGLVSSMGGKWTLHAPFWLPREWDQALHRRATPLFLNQGYPLTLDEEFELMLPAQAKSQALPSVCTDTQPPLHWRIEWASVGHDKLAARFHAELARGELSPEETLRFQEQLRHLLAALGVDASLSVPE